MSLKDLLNKPDPDIESWDHALRVWAHMVGSDPVPHLDNYVLQQAVLEYIAEEPIIIPVGEAPPEDYRASKSKRTEELNTRLKRALERHEGPPARIVSMASKGYCVWGEPPMMYATNDGTIFGLEWNGQHRGFQTGYSDNWESVRRLEDMLVGGMERPDRSWMLWTPEFKLYRISKAEDGEITLETYNDVRSVETHSERLRSAIPHLGNMLAETAKSNILIGNFTWSEENDWHWEPAGAAITTRNYRRDLSRRRWRFNSPSGEIIIYPDGTAYDKDPKLPEFYQTDIAGEDA